MKKPGAPKEQKEEHRCRSFGREKSWGKKYNQGWTGSWEAGKRIGGKLLSVPYYPRKNTRTNRQSRKWGFMTAKVRRKESGALLLCKEGGSFAKEELLSEHLFQADGK